MATISKRDIVADMLRRGKLSPIAVAMAAALPKQREMIESPARKKAAVCGRRSGKTYAAALALIIAALKRANAVCPYICLTKSSARYIMWPVLHEIERLYRIGITFDESKLAAKTPNGSIIPLLGADSQSDMERLRGGKYERVVIDEAGSFPRTLLGYLIDEVLEPATADLKGEIWLIGSPNPAAVGYFYDVTTGTNPRIAKWETRHWTMLDNTHLPHAKEELDRIIKEHGWNYNSPVVLREWLGQWMRDTKGLVYRFNKEKHVQPAPKDLTRFVLGIDLGTSDKEPTTAFSLVGYRDTGKGIWVVSSMKEAAMSPDSIADRINTYQSARNVEKVVCDAGGLGGGYIKHFNQTRRLAVEAAEKKDKAGTIELLNGELDAERLLVDPCCVSLIEEWEILPWNEQRTDSADGCPDHNSDSALYAIRASLAYANPDPSEPEAKPGTPEYVAAWEERWRQRWSQPKPKKDWWDPSSR